MPKPVEPATPSSDGQLRKPSSEGQPRKQSKITIIPSQPKNEKIPSGRPLPRENGRQEPNSRPQLERQVHIERSRSRGDSIPLSKSESTTGRSNDDCAVSPSVITAARDTLNPYITYYVRDISRDLR